MGTVGLGLNRPPTAGPVILYVASGTGMAAPIIHSVGLLV